MAGGIHAGSHQGDQGIRRNDQQQRHRHQGGAHQGVDRCKHMGPLLPAAARQHADHGAVERTVDAPQQNQQETRQNVGIVVSVVGGADPESSGDHLLAQQACHLAEGRGQGHHQGNAFERLRHRHSGDEVPSNRPAV